MKIEIEVSEITKAMLISSVPTGATLEHYLNAIVSQGTDEWVNAIFIEGLPLLQANNLTYTGDTLEDFKKIYPLILEERAKAYTTQKNDI